ncbi:MAG TPA: phospholipase D-like domain-containing protein DpdK [Gemmatimonadaceae bacterium]|nr:phospholipase D-like domain-containing protein DpdK [Gemmatimonadaceae bacterium]
MTSRQVLQTARSARSAPRELLQSVFASELLSPSRCVWIVSPWLRDVPVLDNTGGAFASLAPEFPRTLVRLSHVLRELIARGSAVVIATRSDPGNRQLMDALGSVGAQSALTFRERDELHAKGLVGDAYSLVGSMNLTYNGVERLDEMIVFETAAPKVQELRLMFYSEYGGTL